MITLKKTHFAGRLKTVHFHDTMISDGHWAVRRDYVKNSASFLSEATITATFPGVEACQLGTTFEATAGKGTTAWAPTPYLLEVKLWEGDTITRARLYSDGKGAVTGVDVAILATVELDAFTTLYGPADGIGPLRNALEDATVVVMPLRLPDPLPSFPFFPRVEVSPAANVA